MNVSVAVPRVHKRTYCPSLSGTHISKTAQLNSTIINTQNQKVY
uniref:Uncharacterized protein n=1 Tax=Anguilla anguilla TaxID=7936 RepID=A0A0E9RT30_ANGAN